MKTDLKELQEKLKQKYNVIIQNKSAWNGKTVNDFFVENRKIISALLKEYPKFKYKDVQMLAGLTEGEMPFEKELIQTKLLISILNEDNAVLLPRYVHRILNDTFDVRLNDGSLADCVIFLPSKEQYIEFKLCHDEYLGKHINKATKTADMIFIVVDDWEIRDRIHFKYNLSKRSSRWNLTDTSNVILCDINGNGMWKIRKETSKDLLLFNSPMATSDRVPGLGHRTDEITSPTASLLYLNEMQAVNKDLTISYPAYFLTESEIYFIEKEKYYFLYGGKLDNAESRDEYKIVSDRMKYHGLKSIHPKAIIGSKEDKLWLEMATSVVEFESKTKTKLCSIGAAEFAKNIGVERINIEQILPGFSFENKNEKENKRQGKQQ